MRIERLEAHDAAAGLRALIPGGASVRPQVEEIVDAVRRVGDEALFDFVERFDNTEPPVRVDAARLDAAGVALRGDVRRGLEVATANVAAVAGASLGDDAELTLPQGQRIRVRELPVRRAAIYAPGGRNPYPSTVIMGVVTAQVAGVEEIVVCAPGAHEVILGACALLGVDEVYAMGGAHAVAALAYGTESVARVDVIAGPGSLYVQEAKRLVSGDVGIDGFLGPSDLLVMADASADPALVTADLLAQAEHGEGTIVALVTEDPDLLEDVAARLAEAEDTGAVAGLVCVDSVHDACSTIDAFAPEHLSLQGTGPEGLAGRGWQAGCVFVGGASAVAFGDYIAGSNHSLPTGGAARFASALSPKVFRRRMAEVHIGEAAARLARDGAPIARAEGFRLHAASMEARVRENEGS